MEPNNTVPKKIEAWPEPIAPPTEGTLGASHLPLGLRQKVPPFAHGDLMNSEHSTKKNRATQNRPMKPEREE